MSDSRQRVLHVLAQGVVPWIERYDPETGRFCSEPEGPPAPSARPEDIGWGVINQDIIYALATLYRLPGTRFHNDPDTLEMALRGGDAIRDFQYPDGQVEFLKSDGSRWGPTYMAWTNYAWLETLALLEDELGDRRRQSWIEGLTLAHDGQAREIENLHMHNIPAWKAMSCLRAGQLLGRDDWQQKATAMIRAVTEAQHPGGYWAEAGGPSTLYNHVYVHALGLYYALSDDPEVLPALEAAAEFHRAFTYPNGAVVETIDGRVKYHDRIMSMGLVGFSAVPSGRGLARYLIDRLDPARDCVSFQGGALASACHHLMSGPEESLQLERGDFSIVYRDLALVQRHGPWFACLSAFACPPVPTRWGQDRQCFLSLWHDELGLVLGGGNSKDQPEWSSFAADGRFMPDRGELLPDGAGIMLTYGSVRCKLQLTPTADGAVLNATAENGPALQQLVLQVESGDTVRASGGQEITLGANAVRWGPEQLGAWLEIGRLKVCVPPGTEFRWPTMPFNPYAADGAAPYGSERALLSTRLDEHAVEWRIEVRAR